MAQNWWIHWGHKYSETPLSAVRVWHFAFMDSSITAVFCPPWLLTDCLSDRDAVALQSPLLSAVSVILFLNGQKRWNVNLKDDISVQ